MLTRRHVRYRLGAVTREVTSKARNQSFRRRIVKILCLLPDTIMTLILQAALDASKTRTFIAYKNMGSAIDVVKYPRRFATYRTLDAPVDRQSKPFWPSSDEDD